MCIKISWLCLPFALGALVWGGICLIHSTNNRQDGAALIVEDREPDLGEQQLGPHILELRVRNTSSQPRRMLGMTGH